MKQSSISRRNVLLGSLTAAMGTAMMGSISNAQETTAESEDKVWKYTKLCPKKVSQRVYDSFGTKGCMYGTLKGAITVYSEAIASTDPAQAAVAKAFPFIGMQAGRGGCGGLKSLCGGISGAAIFMALFIDNNAELSALIKKLGEWSAETALPVFHPEKDEFGDKFPTAIAHGVDCKEMGGAWKAVASDDFKKIVGERCKRHVASIMGKAIELLNEHFKEA